MSKPYIGITGFMDKKEVETMIKSIAFETSRQLMIGVLVSNKTINGEKNNHPTRYPLRERLGQIFIKHPMVINMIHYYTDDQTDLCNQLLDIVMATAGSCDGIQLNMPWPNHEELEKFKELCPDKKIVLQINRKMLESSPNHLSMRCLYEYNNLVDYILFDASGGRGLELDVDFLLPFIKMFECISEEINLVVAGGLKSNNLSQLKPLVDIYPNLSIDAESCLRDENDDLVIIKARNYFHEALNILE